MAQEKTSVRNDKVTNYLNHLFKLANDPNYSYDNSSYIDMLTDIFNSKTKSFREIVLVSLIGRKLDKNFRAHTNFYSCKPRAIFEIATKNFCLHHGFPHTKSGPLNIAKASDINEAWAKQRSPRDDANKVVTLIKQIDSGSNRVRENIGVDLMKKYINAATEIKHLAVDIQPSCDPVYLSLLCKKMIDHAPDSGNTPQKIIGYLLSAHYSSIKSEIVLSGIEDSAMTSSTTSNKPGDINEELMDGTILRVYEITVKKFDLPRIIDSYDCVKEYNENFNKKIKEIIVLCRKRDCPSNIKKTDNSLFIGTYEYQDVIYYYWDIYEWISYYLVRMIPSARELFYNQFNKYVNDINTHEKVKLIWNKLHTP